MGWNGGCRICFGNKPCPIRTRLFDVTMSGSATWRNIIRQHTKSSEQNFDKCAKCEYDVIPEVGVTSDNEKPKFDEIDHKILTILQKNGRITNAKLAAEVGLSAPPMLERVKKLERSGLIKSYAAILDAERLGVGFLVFVTLNLDVRELGRIERIEKSISTAPEVLECHHIAGEIDFLLKISVRDQAHYTEFVADHLAQIEGINRMVTWVVLHTSKETRELNIPEPKPK